MTRKSDGNHRATGIIAVHSFTAAAAKRSGISAPLMGVAGKVEAAFAGRNPQIMRAALIDYFERMLFRITRDEEGFADEGHVVPDVHYWKNKIRQLAKNDTPSAFTVCCICILKCLDKGDRSVVDSIHYAAYDALGDLDRDYMPPPGSEEWEQLEKAVLVALRNTAQREEREIFVYTLDKLTRIWCDMFSASTVYVRYSMYEKLAELDDTPREEATILDGLIDEIGSKIRRDSSGLLYIPLVDHENEGDYVEGVNGAVIRTDLRIV